MVRLLVTRSGEDGETLAALLRGRPGDGASEVIVDSLLSIDFVDDAVLDLTGIQALLVTSANGVRALAAALGDNEKDWGDNNRGLPVFAVGDASARAATAAGFTAVESASGDVGALADLVIRRLRPDDGALIHVAGSHVAGDLGGRMGAAGFAYRRAVLYTARTADRLSPSTAQALRDGIVDGVLFFSPRTAATFVTLASEAGLAAVCADVLAFCLSPAVATAAGLIAWRGVHIAAHPTQESLLETIDAALGPTGPTNID